jgi:hypothetical protein
MGAQLVSIRVELDLSATLDYWRDAFSDTPQRENRDEMHLPSILLFRAPFSLALAGPSSAQNRR